MFRNAPVTAELVLWYLVEIYVEVRNPRLSKDTTTSVFLLHVGGWGRNGREVIPRPISNLVKSRRSRIATKMSKAHYSN